MPGFSIPAMEHSTVTSWGKDHEVDAYRNMLTKNPTGLAACVVDSYDTHNAVDSIFGDQLRGRSRGCAGRHFQFGCR
jgi:nicotinamide phosphoribosyltransferase